MSRVLCRSSAATFFGLTVAHMLHVTIGVILIGSGGAEKIEPADFRSVVARGEVLLIPSDDVFHYGIRANC